MKRLLARLRCALRGDHNHETTTVTRCVDCGVIRHKWLHPGEAGYPFSEVMPDE